MSRLFSTSSIQRGLFVIGLFCAVQPIHAATRYVDASPHTPVAPYTSWATAATNIQDAIGSAGFSDTILVADGVYQFGSVNLHGNSRLNTLGKHPAIQSVNGPEVTFIKGSTNNASPVRCAYLTDGTVLSGFTLTNGGTSFGGAGVYCETLNCVVTNCIIAGSYDSNITGGGGANGGTLVDCLLTNNVSVSKGGGACSNTLINCQIMSNRGGNGGGVFASSLTNCLLVANVSTGNAASIGGGGATRSILANCVVSNNVAIGNGGGLFLCTASDSLVSSNRTTGGYGGGAFMDFFVALNRCVLQNNYSLYDGGGACGNTFTSAGSLTNCLIVGNTAGSFGSGGGVAHMVLDNCLVMGNTAYNGAGTANTAGNNCTIVGNLAIGSGYGAGAYSSTLNNSIIYYNQGITNADIFGCALTNCCTSSLDYPLIANSFTNEPSFVDPNGDFHLQSDSPCINGGNNSLTTNTNDLDGNPRIVGGTVDVGAYEFQFPASMLSYAWLQRYGLPTDGSADDDDPDGDGMSNRQEWIADTIPTDASSLLQMYSVMKDLSGVTIYWQSVAGKKYFVQRSGDLSAFATIQTNITGQAGTTGYTDGTTTNSSMFFYRVGVQ